MTAARSGALRYVALIAAAGVGSRFGQKLPKQYLLLEGRTMLEHSTEAMLGDSRIDRVFVVVAPTDSRWQSIATDSKRVEFLAVGGASRAESVLNGLTAIAARTRDNDRILVHDAARPCLRAAELTLLIDQVGNDDSGGLLAVPLTDTVKRGEDGRAGATIERNGLWCAQTPQLFRIASLRAALESLRQMGSLNDVTDEASAVERTGSFPMLVRGSPTNIKVTTEEDLLLARAILAGRLNSSRERA